jgi:CelD/BcsL family acetyltransferase involved in cellulose biosynthesis
VAHGKTVALAQLAVARDPDFAAPVSFREVTSFEELEPFAADWDALVTAQRRPSPYLLFPWLRAWWREHGAGAEPAVQVALRAGTLVGVLPTFVRRRHGLRVLRFLGDARSMLADVLLAPGEDERVARLLLEAAFARADYAALFGLPAGSVTEAAAPDRLTLHERNESPVLDLGEEWDAVLGRKLSPSSRGRLRRKRRRLEELGRLEVVFAETPARVRAAAEDSFRIHALRWRGRPDVSGIADARTQRCYLAAYIGLATERPGTFRIATMRLDGRAIAYHAHFLLGGRMYAHRLGFDPAFARCSPGLLLMLDAFERAAAEGVEVVELLGPAEPYKEPFVDRLEPLHEAIGLGRGLRGRAAGAHAAAIRLRSRLKRHERLRTAYVFARASARRAGARLRRD